MLSFRLSDDSDLPTYLKMRLAYNATWADESAMAAINRALRGLKTHKG